MREVLIVVLEDELRTEKVCDLIVAIRELKGVRMVKTIDTVARFLDAVPPGE